MLRVCRNTGPGAAAKVGERDAQVAADARALAAPPNDAWPSLEVPGASTDAAPAASPPREARMYWTEAMDAELAKLVRSTYYDFDAVADGFAGADIDFGKIDKAEVDGEACRRRWNDLDVANWEHVPEGVAGVSIKRGADREEFAGSRIPSFEQLQRDAAALPERFTVAAANLPSVADFDDVDDTADLKIYDRRTDFDSLE